MTSPLKQEGNTVQSMATSLAPVHAGMGPDEASSALAFATNLAQGMLMPVQYPSGQQQEDKPQQETPQKAPEAPETKDTPQDEGGSDKAELEAKMAEMEKRIMDGVKREVDGIRGAIKDALDEQS